jgi:hypothetical protein
MRRQRHDTAQVDGSATLRKGEELNDVQTMSKRCLDGKVTLEGDDREASHFYPTHVIARHPSTVWEKCFPGAR